MRHFLLCVIFGMLLMMAGDGVVIYAQDGGQRLTQLTSADGPIGEVVIGDGIAYFQQGTRLVRMPLYGEDAYMVTAQTLINEPVLKMAYRGSGEVVVLTPTRLLFLGSTTLVQRNAMPIGGTTLDVVDGQTLVASEEQGVRLLSGSNMRQITSTGASIDADFLSNSWLVIADRVYGLQFSQADSSELPTRQGAAQIVATDGDIVYAIDGHQLRIVDASTPTSPRLTGRYAPLVSPRQMVAVDEWVIVADDTDGLKIYDSALQYLTGQTSNPALAVGLDPTQRWLVSGHATELQIYNARQLPNLELSTTLPLWAEPEHIRFTANGLALVTLGRGGIAVVDLATQSIIDALPFSSPVVDVLPFGPDWVVLQSNGRLLILQYSRGAANPIRIDADLDVAGQPYMLGRSGDLLLVATGRAGLQIFDLTDMASPQLVDSVLPQRSISAVHVSPQGWLLQDDTQLRLWHPETEQWLDQANVDDLLSVDVTATGLYVLTDAQLQQWQIEDDILIEIASYGVQSRFTDAIAQENGVLLLGDGDAIWLGVDNPTRIVERQLNLPQLEEVTHIALDGDDVVLANQHTLIHLSRRLLESEPELSSAILGEYRIAPPQTQIMSFTVPDDIIAQVPVGITFATELNGNWWLGTADGGLWQTDTQGDQAQQRVTNLGGAIWDISPTPDPFLLLLTVADVGLVWVDTLSEQVIRRESISSFAATYDPTGAWLVVARGQCGLQIYRDESMSLVASLQPGMVTDVSWDDEQLSALLNGYAVDFHFDPTLPMEQPLLLLQPAPTTPDALDWRSSADGCVPIEYEVWIDGELAGITTTTQWPLIAANQQELAWYVVAVDSFGNRTRSTTWLQDGENIGWLQTAQQYQALQVDAAGNPRQFPIWLIGIGMAVGGLVGLRIWAQFWQP